MSLRSLNLNLLPVLQALLQERSVSVAADGLAMSQSAASEALAKLRATFDDPLLVRVGSHMELTPRAQEMIAPLNELCRALDQFHRRPVFDAQESARLFTISGHDYATNLVAPPLLAALETDAPRVSVRFQPSNGQMVAQLIGGELDFAILPQFILDDLAPDTLRYQTLFIDRAVAIFDRHHPLAGRSAVGNDDLEPFRMVAFHPGSMRVERRHLYAFSGGHPHQVSAFVPDVALIPVLIRGTRNVAIVPSAFPAHERHSDIVARPLKDAMPALEVGLAWGPLQDADSGHRWLRQLILDMPIALTTASECRGDAGPAKSVVSHSIS